MPPKKKAAKKHIQMKPVPRHLFVFHLIEANPFHQWTTFVRMTEEEYATLQLRLRQELSDPNIHSWHIKRVENLETIELSQLLVELGL